MSVWGGLNSLFVHRLTKTNKKISRKHSEIKAALSHKLSEVREEDWEQRVEEATVKEGVVKVKGNRDFFSLFANLMIRSTIFSSYVKRWTKCERIKTLWSLGSVRLLPCKKHSNPVSPRVFFLHVFLFFRLFSFMIRAYQQVPELVGSVS